MTTAPPRLHSLDGALSSSGASAPTFNAAHTVEYAARGDRVRVVRRGTPAGLLSELTDAQADSAFADELLSVFRACGLTASSVLTAVRAALLGASASESTAVSASEAALVDAVVRWMATFAQELVDEPGALQLADATLQSLAASRFAAHCAHFNVRAHCDALAPLRRAAEQQLMELRHIGVEVARAACTVALATPAAQIAAQFTLLESRLYGRVRATELLPWARERGHATRQAPNLAAAVLRSERVTQWVSSCVLWQADVERRVAAIGHLLDIATECLGLNNYTSIVQIMTGLQAPCVFRLRRTWKALSETHRSKFRSLRNLMASDDNYAAYRSFLALQKPPCVPNLSLYMSDLKRADKAAQDAQASETGGMIAFAYLRVVARTIQKVLHWQQPYALDADPPLLEQLRLVVGLPVAELTQLSATLEPDEAKGPSPTNSLSASSVPPPSPTNSLNASQPPPPPPSSSSSSSPLPVRAHSPPPSQNRAQSPPIPPLPLASMPVQPLSTAPASAPSAPPAPPAPVVAHDADTPPADDAPYPFDQEDTRSNIMLVGGSLYGATLSKLVERLTFDKPVTESAFDIAAFERTFFHQYRVLMQPEALLALLERRFDVPLPPASTPNDAVQKFRLGKQLPIQMKVYNVCHYWAKNFYDDDFGSDVRVEQRFLRFATRLAQVRGVQDRLTALLRENRALFQQRAAIDRACTSQSAGAAAAGHLLDFTAEDLARQLTVDQYVLMRSVRLRSLPLGEAKTLLAGWPESACAASDAPLAHAALAWAQLRQWTTSCVAREQDAKLRADTIVRLIDLAQRLLEYGNFSAFVAVVYGLSSPLISRARLSLTWKAVPSRKSDLFVQYAETASPADGFLRLRDLMSHARAPAVAHLPVLLADMAVAETASSDVAAPMVDFRPLQARANALLPYERFKTPLVGFEWYARCAAPSDARSDAAHAEAAAAESWGSANTAVRAFLGRLDVLDNARITQAVLRLGEQATSDAPGGAGAGDDDGGGGGGGEQPLSPRRAANEPPLSPRVGRANSKRRPSAIVALPGPSAIELLTTAVRAGYLSKKKRSQLMGRWQKRYFVLSGESLFYFSDPGADRPQNEFKLLTTVLKPAKERFQFDLWPAGGGEAYSIMANDDVELIGWSQSISEACEASMLRSLYSGSQPVKTVREANSTPEWRVLLHQVADLPANRKCVDCAEPIDKVTAWASINLGVFICIDCSGVHRSLGVNVSQVRSVALDEWELPQIAVMREIGNQNANELWEHNAAAAAQKPKPKTARPAKEAFIRAKYIDKRWYDPARVPAADEDDDHDAPAEPAPAHGSPLVRARPAPADPSPRPQIRSLTKAAAVSAVPSSTARESMRAELLELLRTDADFRAEVERMLSADLRVQIDEFRRTQAQEMQDLRERLAALNSPPPHE